MSYGSSTGGTGGSENGRFAFDRAYYVGVDDWVDRTQNLRSGKGGIYVRSNGNNFSYGSLNCGPGNNGLISCDQGSFESTEAIPYLITVAALRADGIKTSYSTTGAGTWVSGFGGEYGYDVGLGWNVAGLKWEDPAMMTTDRSTCSVGYVRSGTGDTPRNPFQNGDSPHPENPECKYSSTFNGTSSAAPTVAGSVAMILEANNNLTWRDVKHILASTSAITDSSRSYDIDGINQYSWVTNFAGYSHHNWYGFGSVDIDAAISMAENYNFPLGVFINAAQEYSTGGEYVMADGAQVSLTLSFNSSMFIEYIRFGFELNHDAPETIGMELISPSGTVITILQPYHAGVTNPYNDGYFSDPTYRWVTTGVAGFYGEESLGNWILRITDYEVDGLPATFNRWRMQIYGH